MSFPRLLALILSAGFGLITAEVCTEAATAIAPQPAATADLVQWRNWGPDLPAAAREAGKPIYLFAGTRLSELSRATAQQSFASSETAAYLNQNFVCVRIDLDEQALLGAVVRAHLNLLRQSEGLPVHLWLTPDLRVIEISSYLAPTEEWGKPGFLKLAHQVHEAWTSDPKNCGAKFAETLAQAADAATTEAPPPVDVATIRALLEAAAARCRENADSINGGFGEAPKHPQPELLRFLLTRAGPDRELARLNLRGMANSALRDPLDGGFFRYSTDAGWRLPCLQKLLTDQARLALAYLEADAAQPDPVLRAAAGGALDYVLARLALPGGGYAFSEDGSVEGANAAYLWSADDLGAALGADAESFFQRHQARPDGNLSEEQDPGARFKGLNILVSALPSSADDSAQLAKVAALRAHRPAPVRDERCFVGPQALLLVALSRAGAQLDEPRYRLAADRLYPVLRSFLSDGSAPSVRRRLGTEEAASPTDLAALGLALRSYAKASGKAAPAELADAVVKKLVTEGLDRTQGRFVGPPLEPKLGFLTYRAPALAEPCPAEALALLAGVDGADAALLRAGIAERLRREDEGDVGALLLALAAASD